MTDTDLTIHTDGACAGNPGPGGFAAIIQSPKYGELIITGGDPKTTNNRMELAAIIEALKAVNATASNKNASITIRSDSKYVTDAFNQNWIAKWQRNGWRTAQNKPVLNTDLWKALLDEIQGHHITWTWVKGHSGDPMNERCDRLAVQQAEIASGEHEYWVNVGATPKLQTETAESANRAAEPKPTHHETPTPQNLLSLAIESIQDRQKEKAIHLIRQALCELEHGFNRKNHSTIRTTAATNTSGMNPPKVEWLHQDR